MSWEHDPFPGYAGDDGILPGAAGADYQQRQEDAYNRGAQDPPVPRAYKENPAAFMERIGIAKHMVLAIMRDEALLKSMGSALAWALRANYKPVVLPPWVERPFRATLFGGVIVDASVASGGAWETITDGSGTALGGTIPPGHYGVIRTIGQDVAAAADWDSLTWRIVVGGQPVPGFDNLQHQIGQIEAPWDGGRILIPGGQSWAMQISNSSGSAITGAIGRIHGWYWPMLKGGDRGDDHSTVV